MNDPKTRRSFTPRFSIANLLTLTLLIALATACGLAYQKNRKMVQQCNELQALSSRLYMTDDNELASSEMPRVADDFRSWNVHIPDGKEYHLRLGIGTVSENGVPPTAASVPIAAGTHRVTLYLGDSSDEAFHYTVYIDGNLAIDKTMGNDWIQGGWSSASSLSWPRQAVFSQSALQLAGRSYEPKADFGTGHYFNSQSDDNVTRKGFRLWLDEPNREYPTASPFLGFANDPSYLGIGLRDGLRYKPNSRSSYEWTFIRPSLRTNEPVLRISAEFFASDGTTLSNQTQSFQSWQLRNDAVAEDSLNWQADPGQSVYSAFLQAEVESEKTLQPVVELKWNADRPDEIGLRLADAPANDRIGTWRLRILDGTKHLWRELRFSEKTISANQAVDSGMAKPSGLRSTLNLEAFATGSARIQWRTDQTLPLQILERRQKEYTGLGLYKGLPLTFGLHIPATLNPNLSATVVTEVPGVPDAPLPGGAVFDEIQIELDADTRDWVWLRTQPMN